MCLYGPPSAQTRHTELEHAWQAWLQQLFRQVEPENTCSRPEGDVASAGST
jgi:hypothetical protein